MSSREDLGRRLREKSDEERAKAIRLFEGRMEPLSADGNRVYGAVVDAARALQLWIVARRTNARSLQYVGQPAFVPKPMTCKPKTADRNAVPLAPGGAGRLSRCAGLVVDPTKFGPEVFTSSRKREKAVKEWHKFCAGGVLPQHFSVQERAASERYGCLMLDGRYIYGDLDLFDVIKPTKATGNVVRTDRVDGVTNYDNEYVRLARGAINSRVRVDIVLHGAQATYSSFDDEPLDVFSPEPARAPFSLPDAFAARTWYALRWPGRVPVGVLRNHEPGDWMFHNPASWLNPDRTPFSGG